MPMSPEEKREYRREYNSRPEVREAAKAWRQSPAGKRSRTLAQEKFKKTDKRKKYMHNYNCSSAHRLLVKKWNNTAAGKQKKKDWCYTKKGRAYWHAKNRSKKRKEYRDAWRNSPNGKAWLYKYFNSDLYKDSNRTYKLLRYYSCTMIERVEKKKLLELYNYTCPYCNKKLRNDSSCHIDHIIPLARYVKLKRKFPYSYSTVAPVHASCNLHKQNKTPLEYFWAKGE